MSSPRLRARNPIALTPRTLLPAGSSGGEKVPTAPFPGATATIPPETPDFPGNPDLEQPLARALVQAGGGQHRKGVAQTSARTTRSPVTGLTPPCASVAPITARSRAVTSSEHCFV